MRIVLNMLPTLRAKTGVGHYAAHLAEGLSSILRPGELTTFPGESSQAWIAHKVATRLPNKSRWYQESAINATKAAARHVVGSYFRAAFKPPKFTLYHEPNFLPLPSHLQTVITIHDLSVLLHPEWHPADRVKRHERAFQRAVRQATKIITVSNSVRREVILNLCVDPSRVHAVPNGVSDEFFDARFCSAQRLKYSLPANYLLYIGTVEPRKNLLMLLRAWCALCPTIRQRCQLILAGGWGWKAHEVADYYSNKARHCNVRHLGYIDDDDRPGLMAGARALAFPSHYEGFGLPPLEMLATGGAVIASTAAAHVEVLAGHAHLLDSSDIDGWRSALTRAVLDNDWLAEIKYGGQQHAAQFSWRRTAEMTHAVYMAAVSRRKIA